MKWRYRILILVLALSGAGWVIAAWPSHYPKLNDGDLVFQTSLSSQSLAVGLATSSLYTHMGIIKRQGDSILVVEAAGKVREIAFDQWVRNGLLSRIAVYRTHSLSAIQAKGVVAASRAYYGWPYDIHFSFDNKAMYCSELPYLAFKAEGIHLGEIQTPAALNMDNASVRSLIQRRWKTNPACKQHQDNFEQCYQRILAQRMITPASIARDKTLDRIYSNYPF